MSMPLFMLFLNSMILFIPSITPFQILFLILCIMLMLLHTLYSLIFWSIHIKQFYLCRFCFALTPKQNYKYFQEVESFPLNLLQDSLHRISSVLADLFLTRVTTRHQQDIWVFQSWLKKKYSQMWQKDPPSILNTLIQTRNLRMFEEQAKHPRCIVSVWL